MSASQHYYMVAAVLEVLQGAIVTVVLTRTEMKRTHLVSEGSDSADGIIVYLQSNRKGTAVKSLQAQHLFSCEPEVCRWS